jgi:tRNA 5-methylaminomethyl-2-thiouridine biosynthesis bifunctional protein
LANDFATVGSGAAAKVHAWCRERCAGHDRLPLVGPVLAGDTPSVWMLAGMGSRGLSFSALCAELLASYMGGEPLPLEASLARSLHTTRRYKQRTGPLDGI